MRIVCDNLFIFIKDHLKSQRLHSLYHLYLSYLTASYRYDRIKIIFIKKISIWACYLEESWCSATWVTPEIQSWFQISTFFYAILPLHEIKWQQGKCLAKKRKFIITKKKQNIVYHKVTLDGFIIFFTSVKHVSLTVISSIEYIYSYIKYIKSKSNTQNYQVENNMKKIFAMEKLKTLKLKLHDHGKATSISTRSFPSSKTIKIN